MTVKVDQINAAILEMSYKGNPHPFFQLIHTTLHQLSNRDYQKFDEKYIKLIMTSFMMLSETYYVESERETPSGYLDLSFLSRPNLPVNHQYILELKYLKKADAKKMKAEQVLAKKQLLHYIGDSDKLKDLKNLQAWTVVVVKDEVHSQQVN